MDVSEELRLRRILKRLTQGEVARAAGVCPTVLSDYERGRRVPKPEVADRILAAIARLAEGEGHHG